MKTIDDLDLSRERTLQSRVWELEREVGRLRAALRVNALRWGYDDKEIDKIIYPDGLKDWAT